MQTNKYENQNARLQNEIRHLYQKASDLGACSPGEQLQHATKECIASVGNGSCAACCYNTNANEDEALDAVSALTDAELLKAAWIKGQMLR